ncbi:MAG: sugar ABC transporter ATP-binding protein [Candidatus Aminicenantales bacterium]|jgi:ribose transport system ATP-binding protein
MLELRGIRKRFPGVQALDGISLRFEPGEIHAVVGENGAGKSTLIKVATGIEQPDEGEVLYEGERLCFRDYRDSLARGIDVVNQEIQIIPESTVAENIMLDKLVTYGRTGIIDWKAVESVARRYLDLVGLALPLDAVIKNLSAAHKQLVQIAKALAADARVLFLDEPTSSLTEHETGNLFSILRDLRGRGVTIIFVSHKVEEVFALCDTVSVLRDGRHVGTRRIAGLEPGELVRMMIGREIVEAHLGPLDVNQDREMLRAENVVREGKVDNVSFTLYEGEILGFYGLVGAGRTELARVLIGEDRLDRGAVYVRGEKARIQSVADSLERYRIGYVTENRKEEGLFLQSPVTTNVTITVWPRLRSRLTRAISRAGELALTRRMIRALDIRTTGPNQKTEDLSGGNQQKICISKWLAADCDILIIDEPTVGVDIGAKEQIHQLIWDLAKNGRKAVILISSDMAEVIKIASRILVFKNRRVVGVIEDVDDETKTYGQVSAAIGRYLQ